MSEIENQAPELTANRWKIIALVLSAVVVVLFVALAVLLIRGFYSSADARVDEACADAKLTLLDPEKSAFLSEDELRFLAAAVESQC